MKKNLDINNIHLGDCMKLFNKIEDNTLDCIITSPPYNVDKEYGDGINDKMPHNEYLDFNRKWLKKAYKKLKVGGRICINVPTENNTGEKVYLARDFMNLCEELGFIPMANITWNKNHVTNRCAWGCYDQYTRVLTREGLKFFRDVDIEKDEFATINPITKEMEYQKAFDYIEKDYEGEMYSLNSRTFDLFITPNHNMVTLDTKNDIKIEQIQNLKGTLIIPQKHNGFKNANDITNSFTLTKAEYKKGTNNKTIANNTDLIINMEDWLRFLGIFLTDGNVYINNERRVYNVSIYQSKENIKSEIIELLDRLPFKYTFKTSKSEFLISSKQLATFLIEFGNKNERKIPDFIKELTVEQKQIFIDWLFKGDGSYIEKEQRYFATPSTNFFNALLPILVECGYTFSYYVQEPKEEHTILGVDTKCTIPVYRINIKKSENYYIEESNITKVNFKGKVYCVSVPNKTLFVERNGKFTWCGNSWKSPSCPNIINPTEVILVYAKETRKHEGRKEDIDITKEEFIEYTMGIWTMKPASAKKLDHPAPFPDELPYRLIKLYTYKNDIVLDPFSGTGTTCKMAKKLGRRFYGFEFVEKHYKKSLERLMEE